MRPHSIHIERCNGGAPVISPTSNWWETGVTFNAACYFLERSSANDGIIRALLPMFPLGSPDLADGVVAVHYRARPEIDPASPFGRSFIGLALFTPGLKLLYRYQEPVLFPSPEPDGVDALGVEDPRITRLGDSFYMVYCGVAHHPQKTWKASLCLAQSDDLLHWQKLGPLTGDVNDWDNKDGVLFPEAVDGRYYLFHRPFGESIPQAELAIRLAVGDSPAGPFHDLGEVLRSIANPHFRVSWPGAGGVPISMGGRRFAFIYHTGNYLTQTDREYDLDAAVFDFDRLDPAQPSSAVTARIEHLMTPETPEELRSNSALQVGNVLFSCGSYEYGEYIYIIYGGADTYTLAARLNRQALFDALREANLQNPFI